MRVSTALPPLVTAALLLPLLTAGPVWSAPLTASPSVPLVPRVVAAAGLVAPGVLRGSGVSSPSVVPAVQRSSVRRSSVRMAGSATATAATFSVTYTGFSPAQRDAFQAAVDTWARLLRSPVPITIDAHLSALPDGVLGSAGPTDFVVRDTDGRYDAEDTLLPIALANATTGYDAHPDSADITADFSNDTSLFSYGSASDPAKYDFTTVVLHEIAHGLGFAGAMDVLADGSGTERGYWDPGTTQPRPLAYDRHTVSPNADGSVTPLLDLARGSTQLADALTGGRSLWDGPAGVAAHGGARPELYTPATWQEGSSYSHLDEQAFPTGDPDSLMTPQLDLGEVVRDPGGITLGMLSDIGWGADTRSLRLSGPSSVRSGTSVAVTGAAPAGSTVQLFFKRRGSTTTTTGAKTGFRLQRTLSVGSSGTFATSYLANDDYRYYAQVGSQVSDDLLTQARPTFSGAGTRVVRRGSSVTLSGRGLPSTTLSLRFTRGSSVNVVRPAAVRSDGTWSRTQVLDADLRVGARGANGQSSETTVLLQAR